MSLVHQALQKAEREKQRHAHAPLPAAVTTTSAPVASVSVPASTVAPTGASPAAAPAAVATTAVSTQPWFWPLLILCGALAVALLLLVAFFTWSTFQSRREPVSVSAPSRVEDSTPAAPSTSLSPVAAAPSPAAEPKWKLTGISKGPDGRYFAIINGQLRSESEYVDGAIVHAIERDRVTLHVNGEELVLRLY